MTLLPLAGLADPDFIDRDPAQVIIDMVADYQAATGRTLYPAQVEQLQINLVAYRESLLREAIQDAAKQNLVSFARAPMLDYLGELLGCYRLQGNAATAMVRFVFQQALIGPLVIPAGFRIQDSSGRFVFTVDNTVNVSAGAVQADAAVTAQTLGSAANGIAAGQLNQVLDGLSVQATVANIEITANGADRESDERFRDRVRLAAERPACGTLAAYRYHALTANADIIAVAISSDQPGMVRVSPLMSYGLPDHALLLYLLSVLNQEDIRPLTDSVQVTAPEPVPFDIAVTITLLNGSDNNTVQTQAEQALSAYADELRKQLGRDLVPSEIISRLQSINGVYSVNVTSPALQVLTPHKWPDCQSISVMLSGSVDG